MNDVGLRRQVSQTIAGALEALLSAREDLRGSIERVTAVSSDVSALQGNLGAALADERLFLLGDYVLVSRKECSKEQLDQALVLSGGRP